MKFTAICMLLSASLAQGFVVSRDLRVQQCIYSTPEEVDFDAPIERRMAVGNVVKSREPVTLGPVTVPGFIAKALGLGKPKSDLDLSDLESMDDECYMGKNGDLDDCVDFDPPKKN